MPHNLFFSRSRNYQPSVTEWEFESTVGEWGQWCMLNVMLVQSRYDDGGPKLVERGTTGRIHETAWINAARVIKRIVLR